MFFKNKKIESIILSLVMALVSTFAIAEISKTIRLKSIINYYDQHKTISSSDSKFLEGLGFTKSDLNYLTKEGNCDEDI